MREKIFLIIKGFVAVFVVLSLAGGPIFIQDYFSQLALPLIMFCVGCIFNGKTNNEDISFIGRQVRVYYWPFWCWSLFFLIVHNLFSLLHVVKAPLYGVHELFQRLWDITFSMSGYDSELAGILWLLRALLISSVVYVLVLNLLRHIRPTDSVERSISILAICSTLLVLWKIPTGLYVKCLPDGGILELISIVFVAIGSLYNKIPRRIRFNLYIVVFCFILTILGSIYYPVRIEPNIDVWHFIVLLIISFCGFVVVRTLAWTIVFKFKSVGNILSYIGKHCFCVITFSVLSFKFVDALEIVWYGLPWTKMADSYLLWSNSFDVFWLLRIASGICLPLLIIYAYQRLSQRVDLSLGNLLKALLMISVRLTILIIVSVKYIARAIWSGILGTINALKDIVKASNPREE